MLLVLSRFEVLFLHDITFLIFRFHGNLLVKYFFLLNLTVSKILIRDLYFFVSLHFNFTDNDHVLVLIFQVHLINRQVQNQLHMNYKELFLTNFFIETRSFKNLVEIYSLKKKFHSIFKFFLHYTCF